MSRATRRVQQPMPPPGGWRPMEAADILCPAAAALYRQGGEALEAAIGNELHRLSAKAKRSPEIRPDAWLTLQVLDELYRRPDLQLTGRNPLATLEPRIPVPPDVLRDACERNNGDHATFRRWVHINFRDAQVSSGHDVSRTDLSPAQPSGFAEVRIEASSAPPAQPDASAGGADEAGKLKYTPERCRVLLRWRVEDHPEGEPPPTAPECLAVVRAHFSGDIPRDPFYELRKTVVPEGWQKQGRRG